jgi:hypothetical protein
MTFRRHTCHALDCNHPVPPEKLFCLRHWNTLTEPLRRDVRAHYRPGQCADKKPSNEWFLAATRARLFVAEKEGSKYVPYLKEVIGMMERRISGRAA